MITKEINFQRLGTHVIKKYKVHKILRPHWHSGNNFKSFVFQELNEV
jgi:hypothetical protein